MLKMAVVAAMPSATVRIVVAAKPGCLREHADAVAQVLHRVRQERDAPGVAAGFLHLFGAAERAPCRRARLVGRAAGGELFGDLAIEVIADFLVQLAFDARAAEQRCQPELQLSGDAHISLGSPLGYRQE